MLDKRKTCSVKFQFVLILQSHVISMDLVQSSFTRTHLKEIQNGALNRLNYVYFGLLKYGIFSLARYFADCHVHNLIVTEYKF